MQFIRPAEVLKMIGVSRTTLWRMVQAGGFPRPVKITDRSRGYVLEHVQAWMQARASAQERVAEEPVVNRPRGSREFPTQRAPSETRGGLRR